MMMRVSKIKVVQGSRCVVLDQFRHHIKINVKWEIEWSANSRNTTNIISVVNRYTVLVINSCNTSRNKYIISTALFYCDIYTVIEEAIKVFNRKAFMIAFSKDIIVRIISLAHSNTNFLKRGAVINYYKVIHPKFQQDMLNEMSSECSRSFIWDRNNHDKLDHVGRVPGLGETLYTVLSQSGIRFRLYS